MKATVTGADGLLGSNLVRELLDRGFEVSALIHPSSKSKTLDGLPITRLAGDILDKQAVEDAVRGSEALFHVAASTAMWPPRNPAITAINVEGTRNVADAAEKLGVRMMVHVGSASSFGYGTKEKPGNEESSYKYKGFGLAYFDSKLEAMELVLGRVREGRLNAVVTAPTFMLGPHDSGPSSGRLIARFVEIKPPFYPPGGRNFAHVRDVAAGMVSALDKGKPGECYILGNSNMDMQEFFTIVARVAGIRAPKRRIPRQVTMLAGRVGTAYGELTGKPPELTIEMARSSCIGSYYSADKAVRELGLPRTPIETAIEESYRWLKDNGYIK